MIIHGISKKKFSSNKIYLYILTPSVIPSLFPIVSNSSVSNLPTWPAILIRGNVLIEAKLCEKRQLEVPIKP